MNKCISFSLCLCILLFFSSCATKYPRGTIRENNDVTSVFRSAEVNPDYNYFYYGVLPEPDAILGIEKSYTVETRFWSPLALDKQTLQRLITTTDQVRNNPTFANRYMGRYQGAYVLDPQGAPVGMWYSKLDWGTFEFRPDKVIVPFPPALLESERRRFFRDD